MIGVMFDRSRPPEELRSFARELDDLGVDQLWVVEDLGWAGSIAAAATALEATERIAVGIGIVPAPLRNPVLLAMELATLERLHPGRLIAGIGHGAGDWMSQVGAAVSSPLTLLEETFVAVRDLLAGQRVETSGRYVKIDGIQLVHPPETVPPLLAGVVKAKSLALSGRVADGTILAEGIGPAGIADALHHIKADRPHQLVVLTHVFIDADGDAVRAATAPVRAEYAAFHGIAEQDVFLPSGSDRLAAQAISSLWSAGAGSVVLRPLGDDPMGMVRTTLKALGRL